MKVFALAALVFAAAPQTVYKAGDPGVTNPRVVKEARPVYTAEAMRQKIQGTVFQAVVDTEGQPTQITVMKSLDTVYGLDAKAKEALSQWRFQPATKDGKPVPMLVTVELTFTLRDRPLFDKSSAGVTPPVLVTEKRPVYTAEAMREKVAGSVLVEGIVGTDGRVTDVKVVKGLRPDLDAKAVDAFKQWTFKPATLAGRAVAFRTQVELTFTLR